MSCSTVRIPLNDWGAIGVESLEVEEFAYAATYSLAQDIAERTELGGPAARLARGRQRRDGRTSPSTGEPEPGTGQATTWRTGSGCSTCSRSGPAPATTDLWREWVVNDRQLRQIAERRSARQHYDDVVDAADDWELPDSIRQEMSAWQFDEAVDALTAASEVLTIATRSWPPRPARPDRPRHLARGLRRRGRPGRGRRTRQVPSWKPWSCWQTAPRRLADEPQLLETIGLIGNDPAAELQRARESFESGDLDVASDSAAAALSIRSGAEDGGRIRVLVAGALVLVLDGAGWPMASPGGAVGDAFIAETLSGPIDHRRPVRHLHPALQHRADRRPARLLPGRSAGLRRQSGRQHHRRHPDRRLLRCRAGPLPWIRVPVRSLRGASDHAGRARSSAWWRSWSPPSSSTSGSWAARGCSRAARRRPPSPRSSATSRWPRPATSRSAAGRWRASRPQRWPASDSASLPPARSSTPSGAADSCSMARSTSSRSRSIAGGWSSCTTRPADEERAAGAHHERPRALRPQPLSGASCPRRASGCWRRPGSRSTRCSARGPPSRSSSWYASRRPGFENQLLMQGFSPTGVSIGFAVIGAHLHGRPAGTGATASGICDAPRIIAIGVVGALVMLAAVFGLNHSAGLGLPVQLLLGAVAAGGLFVHGRRHAGRASACWPTSARATRPTAGRSWASTRCSWASARSLARC